LDIRPRFLGITSIYSCSRDADNSAARRQTMARGCFSVPSFGIAAVFVLACAHSALAQNGNLAIGWEVANRFRLFAVQEDFDAQVAAFRTIRQKSELDLEQELAKGRGGRGWAGGVHRLCYDDGTRRVISKCRRDGAEEDYLNST